MGIQGSLASDNALRAERRMNRQDASFFIKASLLSGFAGAG
jgi:hypothetical protein